MTSRVSSERIPIASPAPSQALLDLQMQGLELPRSRSSSIIHLSVGCRSAKSTPSDLDKPLPLEPAEKKRRSSSVYSTDTAISNILRLYGGLKEPVTLPDGLPPVPRIHQPKAYRDTVAPLLVKYYSPSASPSPRPHPSVTGPQASDSPLWPHSETPAAAPASGDKKSAPTFVEFTLALRERRNELVSPVSSSSISTSSHHQAAYDQLCPPSPQLSSAEQSISISQTPPLPDAMSATMTETATDTDTGGDTFDEDLVPAPLSLYTPAQLHRLRARSSVYADEIGEVGEINIGLSGLGLRGPYQPFNRKESYAGFGRPESYQRLVRKDSHFPPNFRKGSIFPQNNRKASIFPQDGRKGSYYPQDARKSSYYPPDARKSSYYPPDARKGSYYPQDARKGSYYPHDARKGSFFHHSSRKDSYQTIAWDPSMDESDESEPSSSPNQSPLLGRRRNSRLSFSRRKSEAQIEHENAEKEKERIMSFAAAKYPGMPPVSPKGSSSRRSSVAVFLRSMSVSKPGSERRKSWKDLENPRPPSGERQVKFAPLPSKDERQAKENGTRQDKDHRGSTDESQDAASRGTFSSYFTGMRRAVSRKSRQNDKDEEWRTKLKESIVMVGPTTNANMEALQGREPEWI